MSIEELSVIFDSLTSIKELCTTNNDCLECPFSNSCICKLYKPKDWILNNPAKPVFKFF